MRRLLVAATIVVAGGVLVRVVGGSLSAPGYQGPASGHFDGETFENQVPVPPKSGWTVARWKLTSETEPWEDRRHLPPGPPPPRRVGAGELRITWINHATVLVQLDGINVLTDPIFSERASPFQFLGPRRYRQPGILPGDLPPIDAVVISHNHYDHLDLDSLRRLARDHRPRIFAGLGTKALLEAEGIPGGEDLDWWQGLPLGEAVRLTAVPAQHWSRRGIGDDMNTLWAGYVLEGSAGPVYYSGDTGWGPHFEQVRERFGPVRLALLPIGAFEPRWFMKHMHISPQEAVEAAKVLAAQISVPIHWGTFPLGDDGQDEPREVLEAHLESLGDGPTFWILDHGEGRDLPGRPPLPLTDAEPPARGPEGDPDAPRKAG